MVRSIFVVERWAEGRFKPMAMLAQIVAANVDSCRELIEAARVHRFQQMPEADGITAESWSRMYHQPRAVQGAMLHYALGADEPGDISKAGLQLQQVRRDWQSAIREAAKQNLSAPQTGASQRRASRWVDLYYRFVHLPMLDGMIRRDGPGPGSREWLVQPEFIFCMAVALPCWIEFRENIWAVYGRAADGHFGALEKILRLDSGAHADERLGRVLHRMARRNPAGHAELLRAAQEGVRGQIELVDVKYLLGGWLMAISAELDGVMSGERLIQELDFRVPAHKRAALAKWARQVRAYAARHPIHCRLNTTDIRSLFDALAQDQGRGLIDRDFFGQPNSIYKRLDRNAKLWPVLWKADIKRAA